MCINGIIGRGESNTEILWGRFDCGNYRCEECAENNVKAHYHRVMLETFKEGKQWYFETYTAHKKMRGTEASILNLREGFKLIAQRKRDRLGTAGLFVKIYEFHADEAKTLHLHVLTDVTLAHKFKWNKKRGQNIGRLNDDASTAGMGSKAEAIMLNHAVGSARYAMKYMSKSAHTSVFPKHFRRIEFSRNWDKLGETPQNPDYTWDVFLGQSIEAIFTVYAKDTYSSKPLRLLGKAKNIEQLLDT